MYTAIFTKTHYGKSSTFLARRDFILASLSENAETLYLQIPKDEIFGIMSASGKSVRARI